MQNVLNAVMFDAEYSNWECNKINLKKQKTKKKKSFHSGEKLS